MNGQSTASVNDKFDANIITLYRQALRLALHSPRQLLYFLNVLHNQMHAVFKRRHQSRQGRAVPPLLIISLTRQCNLNCQGCYSKKLHTDSGEELCAKRFREILEEATELGISIILLAGGEPLLRRDLLEVAAQFRNITFPIFTNSTLLDAGYLKFFRQHRHLIPVISLEGRELETDSRRGDGVWQSFRRLCPDLRSQKLFWGISLTLTRPAFELQFSEGFLREFLECGCRLFFFVEYVPIDPASADLTLTEEQKQQVPLRTQALQDTLPGLFIAFPGDEEQYGGCLAAGRGFLHINPSGMAEPCPFAPFSDVDLKFSSLREALDSPLMRKIRDAHHLLKETEGGCALWANREFVKELQGKNPS